MRNHQLSYQAGSTYKIFILFVISILIVGSGALYLGHWLGFRLGSDSLGETAQAYYKLKIEHEEQQEEFTTLKEQMLRANEERDVSLRNLNDIRNNLDMLQKREKFLMSQRDAFQNMISDEEIEPSLEIFDQNIKPLPENAYEYAFDVVLLKPKDQPGQTVTVDITLLDGDAIVKVPLERTEYEIDGFKRIQGRFIMPKNFTPKKLKVSLTGLGEQSAEQYYNWQFGKRIKKMPQSLIDVPPMDNMDLSKPLKLDKNGNQIPTQEKEATPPEDTAKADTETKTAA